MKACMGGCDPMFHNRNSSMYMDDILRYSSTLKSVGLI
jgi:hypothetical protein